VTAVTRASRPLSTRALNRTLLARQLLGGEVRLEPFEPLPPSTMDELRVEADRLAAFHR